MKRLRLFPVFFVLFALLACGGEEPSSEQPAPAAINTAVPLTNTPVPPTNTPTRCPRPTLCPCAPVPPTNTAVPPTNTPVPPTDTPVSVPHFTVNSDQVNVRTGPGTAFSIIGTVEQGGRFDIGGRNGAGDWLEFCCVNGQRGWIYAPLLVLSRRHIYDSDLGQHPGRPHSHQYAGPAHARSAHSPAGPAHATTVQQRRPGHQDRAGKPLLALRRGRLFVPAECRAPDCRPTGRPHLRPVHRHLFRQHRRDRHRTHRRPQRSA